MRKSKKDLDRRNERELAAKQEEFIEDYERMAAAAKEMNWSLPLPTQDEYVDKKLAEVERSQLRVPTGKYQDRRRVEAAFQQKFVAYIQELCPEVIEELRELQPLFAKLFQANTDKYNDIFDRLKMELFDLDYRLEDIINYRLLPAGVRFRPNKHSTYRFDYSWGEYRLVLNLLLLLLVKDLTEEQKRQALSVVFGKLTSELSIDAEAFPEESGIDTQHFSQRIIEELLFGEASEDLVSVGTEKLTRFLEGTVEIPRSKVANFVAIITQILDWAERHHLEKTWLIRYAMYFLLCFRRNPTISVSGIEVLILDVRSLAGYPFEFKFEGWFAGDERKEYYEERLVKHFQAELTRYFHQVHHSLELDKIKRVTSPTKFQRVKWLVRWTVQGWSKDEIIGEIERDLEAASGEPVFTGGVSAIDKAFSLFREEYDLPVRNLSEMSL